MTLDNVSVPLALAAGAASFLSPCVLPLVPVYISYLVRTRGGAEAATKTSQTGGLVNSVSFVAGVSVVVIALFYALRTLLQPVRGAVAPVAGLLVIVFALHLAGVLRVPVSAQPPRELAIFAGLALGPMMLGHTGMNWALRYLPAYTVNLTVLGEPVGATALAAVLPGIAEIPSPATLAGGAIVLAGVVVTMMGAGRARAG